MSETVRIYTHESVRDGEPIGGLEFVRRPAGDDELDEELERLRAELR